MPKKSTPVQGLAYAPTPTLAGRPYTVVDGDIHTIDSGLFGPYDLVIIPTLQRGHGPNTAAWSRSRKFYNNWDPGKVLTIDVAKILLLEDTEVLRLNADGHVVTEVLNKGMVVYHVMDGGHRLSSVWYAHSTSEDPSDTNYARQDVCATQFVGNVYEWASATSIAEITRCVSKYFVAKNRERNAVSRSDQLKMRVNQGEANALNVDNAVHSLGLFFPYDIDTFKASGDTLMAQRLSKEGRVLTAVGAVEAVYAFFASNGKGFREKPSTKGEATLGVSGLKLILSLADRLYPADDMRRMRQTANGRWQGDWLMGLARVAETNPDFIRMLQSDTPVATKAVARVQGQAKVMGRFGPDAWKAIASSTAGQFGSTMGSNEVIRSYWMAVALVDGYNASKRTGRLNPPVPLRVLQQDAEIEAVSIEDEDDEVV